ncbi:MAG: sigma-54-dependent Fis family transcriptional regulator [Myxococcales bacterium]|nr:sigma-54-dependent Fis family transcriptional regulator [Myxococcales bacterium]
MHARVLLVDDDPEMGKLLGIILKKRGFETLVARDGDEAQALLAEHEIDVVVTDVKMPGIDGITLCDRIVAGHPEMPVVVLTAFGSMETAIAAIRAGAYDFVTKPVDNAVLALAVERAARMGALRDEVRRLRDAVSASRGIEGILGDSPAMREVYDLLGRVASTDSTVLITGESGTGKELFARALHARSRRAHGPFVAINCAAVPVQLLESDLFGHRRGAFTDARADRKGLFQQAHGGTLFLDEVGEMPVELQPKLLRALQERRVRPVGGDAEVPVDVRVVTATNRDLETAIEEHHFREDLYYRLNVITLSLPPLRSRGGDILLLAQHFITRFAQRAGRTVTGLSPEAAARMMEYAWPGNVRELQNAIERAVALARYEQITVEDLPEKVRQYRPSHVVVASDDPAEIVPLEEVERRYILRVMESVGGNKSLAAQRLGLDRKTLYRKLERYGAP